MKTRYAYLNEKGQDLVEYTLMLAFCAALVFSLTSDTFHSTIKALFDRGVFNDVTTHMSAGDYKDAYKAFSEDSRRALADIGYNYGRYYLNDSTKDPIPNELRVATDRKALENIADFFLGMDLTTLSNYISIRTTDTKYFKKDNYGDYILILNYIDSVDVENNYNPYTQTYEQGAASISLEKQNLTNATKANEIIHWMMGDYGIDANGNYTREYTETLDFNSNGTQSSKRYFFSNEMIDPDGTTTGGTVKRNIRISFMLDSTGTKIAGVQVKAQRNGEDISSLQVTRQ